MLSCERVEEHSCDLGNISANGDSGDGSINGDRGDSSLLAKQATGALAATLAAAAAKLQMRTNLWAQVTRARRTLGNSNYDSEQSHASCSYGYYIVLGESNDTTNSNNAVGT